MNTWETVIEYCNLNVGTIGTRKQLIDHIQKRTEKWISQVAFTNRERTLRQSFTTIDCYKNYLVQAGFIHKLKIDGKIKQGKFFIPEQIPIGISIQEVRDKAYGPKLMIMGSDHADPLGQRSSKSLCLTAGHYYVGGTNGGDYMIMDNTANAPPEPKEPEFLSKKEMKL